jgi:hypothetical protein
MKTNTALAERAKPPAPARTPERAALADAIIRRIACEQALAAGSMAVERALASVAKAESAVEAARTGVTAAGERHACELAEAAAGGKPATTNATRKARTALEDAEAELEAATSAHAKLKERLGDLEDQHLDAANRVEAAADIVLRGPAEQALGEAETAALRLRELMPVLQFMLAPEVTPEMMGLWRHPLFDTDWTHEIRTLGRERADRRQYAAAAARRERNAPFEELGAAVQRLLERPPHLDAAWYQHPTLEAWRQARAALHHDADAPLPPI